MDELLADQIANKDYAVFENHLDFYGDDRVSLIDIKNGVLRQKRSLTDTLNSGHRSPKVADALRWMNRKLNAVDAALSRVKFKHNPQLERTGGDVPWVLSLTIWDAKEDARDFWQQATMLSPAQFMAREYRDAKSADDIPVIVAYMQQPDLESIPQEMWDDTNPMRAKNSPS